MHIHTLHHSHTSTNTCTNTCTHTFVNATHAHNQPHVHTCTTPQHTGTHNTTHTLTHTTHTGTHIYTIEFQPTQCTFRPEQMKRVHLENFAEDWKRFSLQDCCNYPNTLQNSPTNQSCLGIACVLQCPMPICSYIYCCVQSGAAIISLCVLQWNEPGSQVSPHVPSSEHLACRHDEVTGWNQPGLWLVSWDDSHTPYECFNIAKYSVWPYIHI